MLKEGWAGGDYVDPDNYGPNHSYMNYRTDPMNVDEAYISNPKLVEERLLKQVEILNKLDKFRKGRDEDDLIQTHHIKCHCE